MALDNNDPDVKEARKRLAESNGKASMLPSMVEKVRSERKQGSAYDVYEGKASDATANNGTHLQRGAGGEIYRYNPKYDITTIELPNGQQATKKGDARPNAMDHYLDTILADAGMTGGRGNGSAVQSSGNGDGQYTAPVTPVERGDELPDPTQEPNPETVTEDGDSSWLQNLLIGGGGATAAYLAAKYFGKGDGGWSSQNGGQPYDVTQPQPDADRSTDIAIRDTPDEQMTPQQRIEQSHSRGVNNVEGLLNDFAGDTADYSRFAVEETNAEDATKQSGKSDRVSNIKNKDASTSELVREAVRAMREQGIDPESEEARRFLADMINKARPKQDVPNAARKAGRNAARGAF